jgi:AraC-like DNA-binding protein
MSSSTPRRIGYAKIPVSTVLTARERCRVDVIGQGLVEPLHRESLDEVLSDLRTQRSGMLIISVGRYAGQGYSRMAALVREFPRVPAIALLTETETSTPYSTLLLGQLGIKRMVDARTPSGWQSLRNILAADTSHSLQRSALAQINLDVPGIAPDCWHFFELLFDPTARVATVRKLARRLEMLPSTLMSRFHRAGLPAPKKYLALSRLILAARLFENPGLSVASVAHHLDYSSPQSFGRHVRTVMRMSPVDFRNRFDGQGMLQHFRAQLVLPYAEILRTFRPVEAYPGWMVDKARARGKGTTNEN